MVLTAFEKGLIGVIIVETQMPSCFLNDGMRITMLRF